MDIDVKGANKKGIEKEGYPSPLNVKLRLNSLNNTRLSMARITRLYTAGEIEHQTYRNLYYGFSILLQAHKLEREDEIIKRIEELEAAFKK